MTTAAKLIREGNKEKIWDMYCGYLDLDIKSYMQIQKRLLLEQIEIIKDCKVGKHFLGNNPPETIEEFRKNVPLTKYADYVPFLLEKDEENLPPNQYIWARTSGRSGEYPCKWVPYTNRIYEKLGEVVVGAIILASCKYKGDINIEAGDVALLATAPRPYTSGYISRATEDQLDMRFVPPLDEGEEMSFGDRITVGFKLAMEYGLDTFFGLASILGKMGERFESGSSSGSFSLKGMKPRAFLRLLKGFIFAKLQNRNMLPKDIWKAKAIMTGGMDTDIFRKRIEYYWGRKPLEGYATTEGGMLGMQSWSFNGMTFFPDCNFYEFIPFDEHLKLKENPSYTPKTLLMDELEPGIYEFVFSNFYGGAMLRYRIGDLLEVIATEDKETGVKLPQFKFYSRADDLIDIGSMARFTETSIWQAIDDSGIAYEDWTARKENDNGNSLLHIYLELKEDEKRDLSTLESVLLEKIKEYHFDFIEMEEIFGDGQFKVSLLPMGAFARYIETQRLAGADLAHIKPTHMQPKDNVMERLLEVV